MSHDPADTLSMVLPSLPPPAPGEGLDVLDPRFPIALKEPAHIFWQLTAEWADRETVIGETIRATQQAAVGEERYVRPLPVPAIPAPVYPQLTEPELAHEWETYRYSAAALQHTEAEYGGLLPDEDDGDTETRTGPPRGPDGRFVSAGGA